MEGLIIGVSSLLVGMVVALLIMYIYTEMIDKYL